MWQSAPGSSIFTRQRELFQLALQATLASWRAKTREHLAYMGAGGYILLWLALPIFQLAVTGLIYGSARPELLRYSVIGIAASTFIFNALYVIGQMLDEERIVGTLPGLFLAPCPRLAWLTGFALGG